MGNLDIWAERVNELTHMIRNGKSNSQIADRYGVNRGTLRNTLYELRKLGLLESRNKILFGKEEVSDVEQWHHTMEVAFPNKKNSDFNYREFLGKAIEMQEILHKKSVNQKEATVEINTDKPIALAFSSDWHLGAKGTDYKAFLKHTDLFLSIPNLFMGALGDYGNFFVKSKMKSAMLGELFGPQEQHDVLKQVFTDLGKKVVFRTLGNHDDFVKDEVGIDIGESFFSGCEDAPYLREGGGINVKIAEQTYRVYAKHKYRFHSSLNPTNSHKRLHDLESPFDIGVLGHRHIPEILHADRYSGAAKKDVIMLLTGTYKVDDTWARAQGFGQSSSIGVPTVILFPDEKVMIPFKYIEQAAFILELIDDVWNRDREKAIYLINKYCFTS